MSRLEMHLPSTQPDPRSFLPLTPLVAQVLLALADEARHGYAIIREVDARTDGLIRLRTGTLYTLLQRLVEQDLIAVAASRAAGDRHDRRNHDRRNNDRPRKDRPSDDRPRNDERRRYYRMTALGRAVLKAETVRLRALLAVAEAKRVLGRS
jgi:DNA-binding PadR family transcriptional regulator